MKYIKHIFETVNDKTMKDLEIISTIHKMVKLNIERDLKDYTINKMKFHIIDKNSNRIVNYADINDFTTEEIRSMYADITQSYFHIIVILNEENLEDDIWFKIHMNSIKKRFKVKSVKKCNYDSLSNGYDTKIVMGFDIEKSFESMYKSMVKINK